MNRPRKLTRIDQLFACADQALRTLCTTPTGTGRANPAEQNTETELSDKEKRHIAGLMRVNHAGEISAQALYQGQAFTAKLPNVREKMEQAAIEENDHLIWCEKRIKELDSHTSVLNPLWYAGSFTIGALAGSAGDKWSLGFVVETENQVVKHLDKHLGSLPEKEVKSRSILEQMKEDEMHHATMALESGAAELPKPVKLLMKLTSKLMTKTAYRI